MSYATAIVGALVWAPVLFLMQVDRGPWYHGTELVAALSPIVAFAIPGVVTFAKHGSSIGLAWTLACAPILAILSKTASFMLNRAVNGNMYSASVQTACDIGVALISLAIGILILVARRTRQGPQLPPLDTW